jgi:hypothetical protein
VGRAVEALRNRGFLLEEDMEISKKACNAVAVTLLVTFAAGSSAAQTAPSPTAPGARGGKGNADAPFQAGAKPEDFGTQDLGITVINFSAFLPANSYIEYDGTAGERFPTTGGLLYAPVTGIPDGATLVQVVFYIRDDSDANGFEGLLRQYWVDSATGQSIGSDSVVDLNSAGSPGETEIHAFPNLPIRYRFDVDGDGTQEVVSYALLASFDGVDGAVRIRGARLTWRRNVSPAPLIASFGDVPTDHPYFRHIEALFASGITAGCGGGNYCPSRAITRGEMAVFLAKALGLHWPAF